MYWIHGLRQGLSGADEPCGPLRTVQKVELVGPSAVERQGPAERPGADPERLAFSPDGKTLVTASADGTARFQDAECGRQLGPVPRHTNEVLCVAFHPDGKSVVTGTIDGTVQRWRVPLASEEGTVEQISQRVRERTGMELDARGVIHLRSSEP